MRRPLSTLALVLVVVAGCGDAGDTKPDAGPARRWFTTCGDPVCSAYRADPAQPACTVEREGAPCTETARCKIPEDACNADLLCAESDPKTNCPISRARFKDDITYLDEAQRREQHDTLVSLPLATWRYRTESGGARRHLGFILEDCEHCAGADPARDRVDLYGYTSMTVAAVQVQDQRIAALEKELALLRAALARRCAP